MSTVTIKTSELRGKNAEKIKDLPEIPILEFHRYLDKFLFDLKKEGKIGMLTYGMPMGDIIREKRFIYLPLEAT